MLRTHQLIATCFAVIALGPTAAAAAPETRHGEVALTVRGAQVVQVRELRPFTRIAYIPAGSDLSSIRIESVKPVKVATRRSSTTNARDCEERLSEPGGSMYCPSTSVGWRVPAVQVTFSFMSHPMASDEFRGTYFTSSVYFRPDELSPGLRRALSSGKISRTTAAELFQITNSSDSVQQVVVDQANSTFCEGNYVDGDWIHTEPHCEDSVAYQVVTSASPYISVKVDPVPAPLERAAIEKGLSRE